SALAAVTALLDEARNTPITRLRSGGVGPKERKRLIKQLDCTDDEVVLWVDLAHAAGLLGEDERGYLPMSEYDRWRAEDPGPRWSELLGAWRELEHAPFARQVADDKQHPPPLPLASGAGLLRRTVLRVCAESDEPVSVRGAAEVVGWWCPLAGYEGEALTEKADAAVAEAERLGVIAVDALSTPGVALAGGDEDGLRDTAAALLPAVEYRVTLQSDLTAVVVGEPPASLVSLLNSVATLESRGTARTWRFSPDSVRAGFDAGITRDELLGRLTDIARHGVPQPLEYLVADVARKYGSVCVSAALCCVRADETQVAEILATKALRKLRLVRLAPTVLASPKPLTEVLAALRQHGLAPVAEDTAGNRMVQAREDGRAATPARQERAAIRARLTPDQLVARLRTTSKESTGKRSGTAYVLAELNPALLADEVEILADAVDANRAVVISYQDSNGKITHRKISELRLSARWLEAWCHLRQAERVFTVSHIDSVAPA
ncbi:MAG: helicase-associated domain-containing protein, partial [Sciscionella sp.]